MVRQSVAVKETKVTIEDAVNYNIRYKIIRPLCLVLEDTRLLTRDLVACYQKCQTSRLSAHSDSTTVKII